MKHFCENTIWHLRLHLECNKLLLSFIWLPPFVFVRLANLLYFTMGDTYFPSIRV